MAGSPKIIAHLKNFYKLIIYEKQFNIRVIKRIFNNYIIEHKLKLFICLFVWQLLPLLQQLMLG